MRLRILKLIVENVLGGNTAYAVVIREIQPYVDGKFSLA